MTDRERLAANIFYLQTPRDKIVKMIAKAKLKLEGPKKPLVPNKQQRELMTDIVVYMQTMLAANQIDSLIEAAYEEISELMWDFENRK